MIRFGGSNARVDAVPHNATSDLAAKGQRGKAGVKRRQQREVGQDIKRMPTRFFIIGKRACGIQQKAKDQRAGDVHDPEIPCLHREHWQTGDVDAGPAADRPAVQCRHVKQGVEPCNSRNHQIGPPVKDATVMLDGFVINTFRQNRSVNLIVFLRIYCHGAAPAARLYHGTLGR